WFPCPSRSSLSPYTTLFRSGILVLYRGFKSLKGISHTLNIVFSRVLCTDCRSLRFKQATHFIQVLCFFHCYAPDRWAFERRDGRSEEHTSELQSREQLVCRP